MMRTGKPVASAAGHGHGSVANHAWDSMSQEAVAMAGTAPQERMPRLSPLDMLVFLRSSSNVEYYRRKARPMLYRKCGNDPEYVHDFVLYLLHRYGRIYSAISRHTASKPPKNLEVKINGVDVIPFGTAAGMDKDLEALHAFGSIFGFQEPGTIVVRPRPGNPRVRVATIDDSMDMVNAQGFPSKGLDYALKNIREYRRSGGKGIIYASICGLPGEGRDGIDVAMSEVDTLASALEQHVDGFVWNPYSPNTAALARLRDPDVFRNTAKAIRKRAPGKLLLVKMGPYEPEERGNAFALVSGFIEGGGNGVVTTNTKMLPKGQLPERVRNVWGYASAGRSGRFLGGYRMRSVKEIRRRFPDAVIAATGGICTADDAFKSFCAGANLVEGFTPYAYLGTGLVKELMKGVSEMLVKRGTDLESLQRHVSQLAAENNDKELDRVLEDGKASGGAMA